jgi:TPR repeat protein
MRCALRGALILAAAFSLATASAADAPGATRSAAILAADSDLTLREGEGHVVIAFDLLDELANLRFVGSGEWLADLALVRVPYGFSITALRMPAGSYCLGDFKVGKVHYRNQNDPNDICFKVFEGVLTYTGHLTVRAGNDPKRRTGVVTWEWRPAEFLARLQRELPALLTRHDDLRFGASSDGSVAKGSTLDFAMAALDDRDPALGLRLSEAAIRRGSTAAMLELGRRYSEAEGLPEDRETSVKLFAAAAMAGETRGAFAACLVLQDPYYEDARLADALKFCELGAKAGNGFSMASMAKLLRRGVGGAKPDLEQAYGWALSAAELGEAEGMYQTAVALRDGAGTKASLAAAIVWLDKAVALNHAGAAGARGALLEAGRGSPPDPVRVIELYQIAADGRDAVGLIGLGNAHFRGRGVPRDYARAKELLKSASRRSPDGEMAYAWFLATCPDESLRDGKQARFSAMHLIRLPDRDSLEDYAVFAAGLADAGDFYGAMREVQRAIDARVKQKAPADDPQLLAWRAQLASYQRDQPWREP